jgi:hypothetical protein
MEEKEEAKTVEEQAATVAMAPRWWLLLLGGADWAVTGRFLSAVGSG